MHDFKKPCIQYPESSYGNGTTTPPSHRLPSWNTQDGSVHHGSMNELQQSTCDTYSSNLLNPQGGFDEILWPDRLQATPVGDPALIDSRQVNSFQNNKRDMFSLDFGFDSGKFTQRSRSGNGNPMETSPLPIDGDTEFGIGNVHFSYSSDTFNSDIGHILNNISQREDGPAAEPFSPPIKKECVDGFSNPTTLVDDRARLEFQLCSDGVSQTTEDGNRIFQMASMPTTKLEGGQSSSDIALESLSSAVNNDEMRPVFNESRKAFASGYIHDDPTIVQYDACFGAITVNSVSSFNGNKGAKVVPVDIRPFGDILKIYFQDSAKYAGLLTVPVLSKLLDEFNVKFTATLIAPQQRPSQASDKGKVKNPDPTRECSVRVIVYGLMCEKSDVGNLLSGAGLFLQQPSATECMRDVEYSNPHYLVRPGSQMPKLDELSISSDVQKTAMSEALDEASKNRFMRMFDFANETSISSRITPSPRLRCTLKDHQLEALTMMVEKECGSVKEPKFPALWELNSDSRTTKIYRHKITGLSESSPILVYGGILADEMGLGKTLSLLALICSCLDRLSEKAPSHDDISRTTLIITPKSTIPGWQQQISRHIHPGQMRVAVYHGSTRRGMSPKFKNNDIVLTTYETVRSDWAANGPLYSEKWYRVVLDEAHHIRNRLSQTFKAACAIVSQHRWCLTGTPIHNSLDDYGALLTFVGVPPFTDKSMFDFWITSPLKNGKPNSLRRLQDLIKATCLRRTKRTIGYSFELPQRIEKTETIEFHRTDQELYNFFKEKTAKVAAGLLPSIASTSKFDQVKENNILSLINFLRLICNQGEQLLPQSALDAWKGRDSTSIDWQMMQNCRRRCDICNADIEATNSPVSSNFELRCQHSICAICVFQYEGSTPTCPKCVVSSATGTHSTVSNSVTTFTRPSAKIETLLRNLRSEQILENCGSQATPVKSVIFSYWTKMLDLIQQALESNGFGFQRIDGKTSLEERSDAIRQFNEDFNCTILLASIGSAGEGVDLTVANHVHLIEPHWNPMAEAQAVDRVHRIGQAREVVITRYVMRNSIETYIQWIQQDKLRLINQSIGSEYAPQSDIDNERWKKLKLSLI